MRIVGEAAANTATTSEANLLESEVESLLAGGMFEGVLLNGMDVKRRNFSAYKYGRYRYTNYNYESILPEEQ